MIFVHDGESELSEPPTILMTLFGEAIGPLELWAGS